jgi:hypothetical protein
MNKFDFIEAMIQAKDWKHLPLRLAYTMPYPSLALGGIYQLDKKSLKENKN